MKFKDFTLKDCPRCKGNLLAVGKGYSYATPRIVRFIRREFPHGVSCLTCGQYKPTIKAWNRRAGDKDD